MTSAEVVTVKEYFEAMLKHRDRALEIQAREYERRLEKLNHAHEQAQVVMNTYVTIARYNADSERLNEFKDRTEKDIALRGGKQQSMAMVGAIIYSAVIATMAVAGVIINLLRQ